MEFRQKVCFLRPKAVRRGLRTLLHRYWVFFLISEKMKSKARVTHLAG